MNVMDPGHRLDLSVEVRLCVREIVTLRWQRK